MDRYPRTPYRLPHKQLLDLARLEHESRRYLYLGFAVGIIIHAIAGLFIAYDGINPARRQTAISALPAELIEIPPRAPNPYRDWRRRTIHRPYTRKPATSPSLPGLTLAEPQRLSPGPNRIAAIDQRITSALIDEQITDAYT
ncbi:hypothetical protein GF324_05550, partial [bacterium]|nr:hypothetical protein [bacterium]